MKNFFYAIPMIATLATPAFADHMKVGQEVVPPYGYISFCVRNVHDCSGGTNILSSIHMDENKMNELTNLNAELNKIPSVEDIDNYHQRDYWTYPNSIGADCEDYALLKRKVLIEKGWPEDSLLLAKAILPTGEGHLVLLVVTDDTEYVLDNLIDFVYEWKFSRYKWISRQDRNFPFVWVNLDEDSFKEVKKVTHQIGIPYFIRKSK